jgi:hypothetical protein
MDHWIAPLIIPFQRLQVRDGVQLNLDKWNLAHQYHERRQSYYYQSLYQPGIIDGLGVKISQSNTLEIQPGIALDYQGKIIIVPEKQVLSINFTNLNISDQIIYLVISYREQNIDLETIIESYSLTFKTGYLDQEEIELAQIKLENKPLILPQNLNLNNRPLAKPRSQATVNIAIDQQTNDPNLENNLFSLLQALKTLYPSWKGAQKIQKIAFNNINNQTVKDDLKRVINYDLIYFTNQQFEEISQQKNFRVILSLLKFYLENGGVFLVEELTLNSNSKLFKFAELLNTPLQPLEKLPQHPLWLQPFLFQKLPQILEQKLSFWVGGGIILVIGNLASGWGFNPSLSLPSTTIQTAQELGINLLHFAWYRRHLTQLQIR